MTTPARSPLGAFIQSPLGVRGGEIGPIPGDIWVAAFGGLYSLPDGATSWSSHNTGAPVMGFDTKLARTAGDNIVCNAGSGADQVWEYDIAGDSWSQIGNFVTDSGSGCRAVCVYGGEIYGITSDATPEIWKWGGTNWSQVGSALGSVVGRALRAEGAELWAFDDDHPFQWSGTAWVDRDPSNHLNAQVTDGQISEGRIFAARTANAIYEYTAADTWTSMLVSGQAAPANCEVAVVGTEVVGWLSISGTGYLYDLDAGVSLKTVTAARHDCYPLKVSGRAFIAQYLGTGLIEVYDGATFTDVDNSWPGNEIYDAIELPAA